MGTATFSDTPRWSGSPVDALPDDPEATLQLRIVMGFLALGASVGVPMPEVLAVGKVQPSQLSDPDAVVPIPAAVAMLSRVAEAMPGKAVSLALMSIVPPSAFGLVDLASRSAATVQDGLDVYLRFARLTSSGYYGWVERGDGLAAYRCRHLESVEAIRHPVEIAMLHGHRILHRAGVGAEDIVEVHFRHAPVGPEEAYREHFGCPVFFESVGAAVVVREQVLARPMQHADPVLSRSLVARLEAELPESDDALAGLRREIAAHANPAGYAAAEIAQRMGRSLRSLQRDASRAGTTLRRVIDDVRVARARELLQDPSLSVDEVGFVVGYSERAAFSRAFKRATGETPVEYRRRGRN